MGSGASKSAAKAAAENSTLIDKEIKNDREKAKKGVKLLLLGAGESGKSTIVKQMKIIHCDGYTLEERIPFKPIVYSNATQSLLSILYAMIKDGVEFRNASRLEDAELLFSAIEFQAEPQIPCDLGEIMERLWKDEGMQRCFSHSGKYQINDSAAYFLNEIKRISAPDYSPTDQDILNARARTTGITYTTFFHKDMRFKIVDVGGQRSERLKWLRCFEDVTAIIFCVALSEYDLMLEEDSKVNRMFESMKLYERICNNKLFAIASIIVFFNKIDIFRDKITLSPLTICFPDFEGQSYQEALDYIQHKFLLLRKDEFREKTEIYSHVVNVCFVLFGRVCCLLSAVDCSVFII